MPDKIDKYMQNRMVIDECIVNPELKELVAEMDLQHGPRYIVLIATSIMISLKARGEISEIGTGETFCKAAQGFISS
ncbi:hypothetical protein LguiA_005136 [Lonicera macranthoides]